MYTAIKKNIDGAHQYLLGVERRNGELVDLWERCTVLGAWPTMRQAKEMSRFSGASAIVTSNRVREYESTAVSLGRKGGSVKNPNKGMGSATPEQRAERAAKMVAARRAKATAAAPTPGKPPATA